MNLGRGGHYSEQFQKERRARQRRDYERPAEKTGEKGVGEGRWKRGVGGRREEERGGGGAGAGGDQD